jgi:hypothetical protein
LLHFYSHFFQLLANGICRGTFIHCAPNALTKRKAKLNLAHQSINRPDHCSKDTALSRMADLENSYLLSHHHVLIRGTLALVHFYARNRTNYSRNSPRQ